MILSSLSPLGLILTLLLLCIIVYVFIRNIKKELGLYSPEALDNNKAQDIPSPGTSEDETGLIIAAAAYYYLNNDENNSN